MRYRLAVLALALLTAAPLRAGELKGRLLIDDRPAGNVKLAAFPHEDALEAARREAKGGAAPEAIATVTTRGDGTFTLAVPPSAARFALEAVSGAVAQRLGVFEAAESEDLGDLAAAKAEPMWGKVVDAERRPIEAAEVELYGYQGEESRPLRRVRTAADGTFRFEDAAQAGNGLIVRAAGYGVAVQRSLRAGVVAKPIVLAKAAVLKGLITRSDRKTPAASVLVRFEALGITRWVLSADDGIFVLPDVPLETGRLIAYAGEGGYRELPNVNPRAAADRTFTLALGPPSAIEGRVVDAQSGKAVARAKVTATAPGTPGHLLRTAPDGRYRFRPLSPGSFLLRVDEPRYARFEKRLPLAVGEVKAVDVPLELGATLGGKVVDEDGKPVTGAVGRLTRRSPEMYGSNVTEVIFRSAADGTFKATRLQTALVRELNVAHPDFELARIGALGLSPGATRSGVRIVLKRGASLMVRVVDKDDQPIAGAEVEASPNRPGNRPNAASLEASPPRTGPDGRVVVKALVPGDYQITASKRGYAFDMPAFTTIRAGQEPEPVTVKLPPAASISGFVRRKDGSPVAGVRLVAGTARGRYVSLEQPSGADGSFTIDGLLAGQTYSFSVNTFGSPTPTQASAVPPAEGVEVKVSLSGRVSGRVVDEKGRPVTDFLVAVRPQRGSGGGAMRLGWAARTSTPGAPVEVHSDDGAFAVEDAPGGSVQLLVDAKDYQPGRTLLTLEEGETRDGVEVRLTRGGSLSGRVVDARSGRAVPGASILGISEDAVTDADGRFQASALTPGKLKVTAQHPDYAPATEMVEVSEGKPAQVELRLSQGAVIGGVVLTEDRQGVAGAEVRLDASGEAYGSYYSEDGWRTAGEGGQFRFEHVQPGRYKLLAEGRSRTSGRVEVVLQPGESREDLVLTLGAGATVRGVVRGLSAAEVAKAQVSAIAGNNFNTSRRVAPDGTFELDGVPSGPITLMAVVGDRQNMRRSGRQITVSETDRDVQTELVFEGAYTLSGRVMRGGQPVAEAMVNASNAFAGGSSTTDASGEFRLEGLKAGDYQLTAYVRMGMAPVRRKVTVNGDQTLDLELAVARVAGLVLEAGSRRPLADASLYASADGMGNGGYTDSNGRFEVRELEAKPYTLTVRKSGYKTETKTVTPSESAGEDVVFELARGEGLAIQVRDGIYGIPLRSVIASVGYGEGRPGTGGMVPLDAEGRGEIPSIGAGRHKLRIYAQGYAAVALDVNVPASSPVPVSLTPGGTLELRIGSRTLDRKLVARILDAAGGTPPITAFYSPDDKVPLVSPIRRFENLAPGGYQLAIEGGESKAFTITEGGVTVLELP